MKYITQKNLKNSADITQFESIYTHKFEDFFNIYVSRLYLKELEISIIRRNENYIYEKFKAIYYYMDELLSYKDQKIILPLYYNNVCFKTYVPELVIDKIYYMPDISNKFQEERITDFLRRCHNLTILDIRAALIKNGISFVDISGALCLRCFYDARFNGGFRSGYPIPEYMRLVLDSTKDKDKDHGISSILPSSN